MRVFVHMYNMYEFLEKIHTYVHSYMHACMCTYMQAAFAGSLWTLKQMLAVKWLPASDLLAWPQNCNPTRLGVWGLGFRVRGFCVRCYEGQWSMLCATSSSGRRVPVSWICAVLADTQSLPAASPLCVSVCIFRGIERVA